jgi:HEAT repeat protein
MLVVALLSGQWLASPAVAAAPMSNVSGVLAGLVAEARDRNLEVGDRVRSIEVLGKWGTAEVREALVELLKDPAPEIREASARGLGWAGNTPASAVLQERVRDKAEQGEVRVAAIGALIKIGDAAGRPVILQASRDSDAKVREAALRGVVGGPMESAADRFALAARAVEDDGLSLPFRADAIRALAATKDPAAIGILVKVLETGPRAKIESPPANATQQQLLAVRYLQIGDIRAWAIQGLGELGDRAVLAKLLKATEDPDDFFLRYVAAGTLIGWREPRALPALLRLLDDPASEVRTVAVIGVGELGNQANVDVVAARLTDKAITVRVSAVQALATIGGDAARERLQAAHNTETNPQVRQALEEALARLQRPMSLGPGQGRAVRIALSRLRQGVAPWE